MSSYESLHDEMVAEKADRMRMFRRKRNVFFCLQLAGALVLVLLCCSFTWILGFKALASDHPSALKFFVFFLIKVIVWLVYLLSADDSCKNNDAVVGPDVYDQYISFSFSISVIPSRSNTTVGECNQLVVSPEPEILSEKAAFRNKQIVHCGNVEYSPIEGKHGVRELKLQEEVKHYRRTRSEPSTREKTSRRRQLRRSETKNQRQLAVADCYRATTKSMEDMNGEEFRHAIESYIATQKKILKDENRADGPRLRLI